MATEHDGLNLDLDEWERLAEDYANALARRDETRHAYEESGLYGGEEHRLWHKALDDMQLAREAYIAAMNPQTVLALLAEAREARGLRERVAVAEEALEIACQWWERDTGLGSAHDAEQYARHDAELALGLPPVAPDAGEPGVKGSGR